MLAAFKAVSRRLRWLRPALTATARMRCTSASLPKPMRPDPPASCADPRWGAIERFLPDPPGVAETPSQTPPAAAFGLVQHADRQSRIGHARRRGAAAGGCGRRHSCQPGFRRASGLRAYIGEDDDMDRNYMRRADILGCFARRPFGLRVASHLSG